MALQSISGGKGLNSSRSLSAKEVKDCGRLVREYFKPQLNDHLLHLPHAKGESMDVKEALQRS